MQIGPADPAEIIADDKRRRYRLDGDKPKVRNGSYQLKIEGDGFAVGWAMSFREGVAHSWHAKTTRKASPEERAAFKAKAVLAKQARVAEEKRIAQAAADKAKVIWGKAGKAGSAAYLERKGITELHGTRVWNGLVVVPMYGAAGMVGLQFIAEDGAKRFLTGTAKEGAYFPIATKDESKKTLVICEGFATAVAIRVATGFPVIAAFDAGNLQPVAVAMRAKYPDAEIIIGADCDQWTTRQDGSAWNPGIEKAHSAAMAIGGARVIAPSVDADDEARRTDWDDILRTDGPEAIRDAFAAPPSTRQEEEWRDEEPIYDDYTPPEMAMDALSSIRPLGHNRGYYSFFPRAAGQIVTLSAAALSKMQSLYMLAPRSFWEGHYGGEKASDSEICAYASAHLMEVCHQKGVFQPESTRGVGAWLDGGRPVVNCGDVIKGPGIDMHPAEFEGEAVYESGPRVVHLGREPLPAKDAVKLRQICKRLIWKRPQYGDMLAGWLVIAPIGSALRWRPHIWVTGKSGAGKSTVIDEIVKPVLGDIAIKRDGGTSEAGVRKSLGASGRPYVLDEAESETQAQRQEMEKIIYLARRASSGGVVENANATYQVRSCFCFAAINPRVEQVADRGRITQIEIKPDDHADRKQRFDALLSDIHATLTVDFARGLFARTVENLPTLLHNVEVFSGVAAEMFGNRRSGDQIGPMIAGAFLLTSTRKADPAEAREWMEKQDWQWHTTVDEDSDAFKLVTHIMTSRIRFDAAGMSREMAIGDMVQAAADRDNPGHDAAVHGLKPYGIRVEGHEILIANQAPNLRKLLAETPYIPWARTLGDFPGANNKDNKAFYFMAGLTGKVTAIPLHTVIEPIQDEVEIPFEEDDAWR